jgi:hypothetical protein
MHQQYLSQVREGASKKTLGNGLHLVPIAHTFRALSIGPVARSVVSDLQAPAVVEPGAAGQPTGRAICFIARQPMRAMLSPPPPFVARSAERRASALVWRACPKDRFRPESPSAPRKKDTARRIWVEYLLLPLHDHGIATWRQRRASSIPLS